MYMAHEEAGLITGSEEVKDRQRDFIWALVRSMLKGEDHEKENPIGTVDSDNAVAGDIVQLAS